MVKCYQVFPLRRFGCIATILIMSCILRKVSSGQKFAGWKWLDLGDSNVLPPLTNFINLEASNADPLVFRWSLLQLREFNLIFELSINVYLHFLHISLIPLFTSCILSMTWTSSHIIIPEIPILAFPNLLFTVTHKFSISSIQALPGSSSRLLVPACMMT